MSDDQARYGEMLRRLAQLLGKEADDPLLALALDGAVDTVKNYCGLREVPEGLCTTVVDMARDDFREGNYGGSSAARVVASVKRGDVQTAFATGAAGEVSSAEGGGRGVRPSYLQVLNAFRRTEW